MKTAPNLGDRALRVALVLGLAAVVGACRSDGGIGRRTALQDMRWTLDTIAGQQALDVESTQRNVSDLGTWIEHEVTHSTKGMRRTLNLYLEGSTTR